MTDGDVRQARVAAVVVIVVVTEIVVMVVVVMAILVVQAAISRQVAMRVAARQSLLLAVAV